MWLNVLSQTAQVTTTTSEVSRSCPCLYMFARVSLSMNASRHPQTFTAYLLQYATQVGLVLRAGFFSFHPQQQFRLPVRFQSKQVDDTLPQGLLGRRSHAPIPSVVGRLLLEAAVRPRQRSWPFVERDTFTWRNKSTAQSKIMVLHMSLKMGKRYKIFVAMNLTSKHVITQSNQPYMRNSLTF